MRELTELLDLAIAGDSAGKNQLFSDTYQELRRMASQRLRRLGPVTLLDTTSLVHESYLRFLNAGNLNAQDRSRFLAYAARVMRSVVIDFVRESQAERRGGDLVQVTLNTEVGAATSEDAGTILKVSEALDALASSDERLVQLVEMKYFAGYNEREIAECLGISERTLRREWQRARLLLHAALT